MLLYYVGFRKLAREFSQVQVCDIQLWKQSALVYLLWQMQSQSLQ